MKYLREFSDNVKFYVLNNQELNGILGGTGDEYPPQDPPPPPPPPPPGG